MNGNATLIARQRARERTVEAAGHKYVIRRPKAAELAGDLTRLDLVRRFVVGWDLANLDLVPGGTPDPEPFDASLWADYVEDDERLWLPLSNAILALHAEHQQAKEDAAKN